jgi:sugar lactone lactonase YvrE
MSKRFFAVAALLISLSSGALAQGTITTVAGGVPNNVPATSVGTYPQGVSKDSAGNLYLTDAYCSCVFKVASNGQLTLVAGNGSFGFSGDGGPATSAQLDSPSGVSVDGMGNVFIADQYNSRVREVVAATGIIQTVAGNGTPGFSGDGGPATSAELTQPSGVSVDGAGNIYIADDGNQRIRKVTAGNHIIQTVAGNGTQGFGGDGGVATSAELFDPYGVCVDGSGNIFIADTDNHRIREVTSGTGTIQTVAGNGTPGFTGDGGLATGAELRQPSGVSVDGAGNIYIADDGNQRIRKVTAGNHIIQTVAGNGTQGFGGDGGVATSAELDDPLGVFIDGTGNIFIVDTANFRVREVASATGIIQTAAGNGTYGFSGDGGAATSAELDFPSGVFVDAAGNIFFADSSNNRVREVVAATGLIETVAGNGAFGFSGDGGVATSAQLDQPEGVFVDHSGNIFISDSLNNRIREVVAGTGIIQTVAGNGTAGFNGDGGPATSAELNKPEGIFVDGAGNIFISDAANQRIRKVAAAAGTIQTVAGNGTAGLSGDGGLATSAQLDLAGDLYGGVYVDGAGDIFISDSNNNRIREVMAASGIIQTIAGSGGTGCGVGGPTGDGGPATSAQLNAPNGVFVDGAGNVFFADTFNSRIREVVAATGIINTVAGSPGFGFSGDGGPATSALLYGPTGVFGDNSGNIFFADTDNNRIRKVTGLAQVPAVSLSASSLTFTTSGASQSVTLTNSGSAPLTISGIAITGSNPRDFAFVTASTTCPTGGGNLASNASCTLSILFQPTASGTRSASIAITDNAAASPQSVSLTGTTIVTVQVAPATVNLVPGGTQQFTATVGGVTNTSVTWSISGTGCSGSACGSVSSQGLYTAPTSATSTFTVTVTATSVADATKSASATVTVQAVSVSIAPTSATVSAGLSAQFTATVTGATNTAVTWQVNGIANGNATFGTISASGLYTAPSAVPTPAAFAIKATSVADTTKSASATVTITAPAAAPVSVQISPQPSTVVTGSTVQFGAVVMNAGTTTAVTWQLVSGAGTGSITAAGLYTPPATAPSGSVIVQATSVADPTKTQQISFTVAPAALNFAPGQPTTVPPISAQSGGSSSANLVLNLAPTSGSATFTLTCDQMPPGAACTVNPTTLTAQGGHPGAPFTLTVLIASSSGMGPLPSARPEPWLLFLLSLFGSLWAIYRAGRSPVRQARYAWLMVLLISFSVAYLAACSGISSTTVSSPPVSAVRSGSVIDARVTATPTSTTGGFTATQMIVPFPVQ